MIFLPLDEASSRTWARLAMIELRPREALLAFLVCSVIAVIRPIVCSKLLFIPADEEATTLRPVAKSPVPTAKLFATSFSASAMCIALPSTSPVVLLNAINWEIKNCAASPVEIDSSATFWNIELTRANWAASWSLNPFLRYSVAASTISDG